MAVGDSKINWASVAASTSMDVNPAAGEEWLVHTVALENASTGVLQVYLTTGSSGKKVDTFQNPGSVHGLMFRLSTAYYMQLVNGSTNAAYLGYQGVQTK